MKVIGKTATGYLVEMSATEIANAAGYPSKHDQQFQKHTGWHEVNNRSLVGLEIPVTQNFARLARLARRDQEFDALCNTLRSTAAAIEDSKSLFDAVVGDKP